MRRYDTYKVSYVKSEYRIRTKYYDYQGSCSGDFSLSYPWTADRIYLSTQNLFYLLGGKIQRKEREISSGINHKYSSSQGNKI